MSAPSVAAERVEATGHAAAPARHVAIIMDGNGRWAARRHLPRLAGHRRGVDAVRAVARAARGLGLEALTLYAFSTENWSRPAAEVSSLMGLLRHFLERDVDELVADNVRLRVLGDLSPFAADLRALITRSLERTAANTGPILAIALNYGARAELAAAARGLAERVAAGELRADDIDELCVEQALATAGLPPLDLMIRTSGEQRLSNFLLWQAAYAELMFVDTLWPDFGPEQLADALARFAERERRFGGDERDQAARRLPGEAAWVAGPGRAHGGRRRAGGGRGCGRVAGRRGPVGAGERGRRADDGRVGDAGGRWRARPAAGDVGRVCAAGDHAAPLAAGPSLLSRWGLLGGVRRSSLRLATRRLPAWLQGAIYVAAAGAGAADGCGDSRAGEWFRAGRWWTLAAQFVATDIVCAYFAGRDDRRAQIARSAHQSPSKTWAGLARAALISDGVGRLGCWARQAQPAASAGDTASPLLAVHRADAVICMKAG